MPTGLMVSKISSCVHDYVFLGDAGYRLGRTIACVRPQCLLCVTCGNHLVIPCGNSNVNKCRDCGLRYKRKVKRRITDGIGLVPAHAVACLTFTPPGVEVQCRKHVRCTGGREDDCEVYATITTQNEVAEWNGELSVRQNRLVTAIRRGEASPKVRGQLVPIEDLDYFCARERGDKRYREYGQALIHGHMVLRRSSGAPMLLSERKMQKLLVEHGFGRKFTLKSITGDGAANYLTKSLAKYVSKGVAERFQVECVRDGVIVPWRGRLWTSSQAWSGVARARDVVRLAAGQPLVSLLAELCDDMLPADPEASVGLTVGLVKDVFPGSHEGWWVI